MRRMQLARPIESIRMRGYKGCGRADLSNIVNMDAQLNAWRGACVMPHCCATYCEPGRRPCKMRGVARSTRGTYPRFRALRRTLHMHKTFINYLIPHFGLDWNGMESC